MFYVFHGDDEHGQRETLASLLEKQGDPGLLDLNTTRFEGQMAFSALRQACDALPFLAPVRIVLASGLFASKPDKTFVKQLVEYLPDLPAPTRLVFLEASELPQNHPVLRLALESDNGVVRVFRRPQGSQLERWIQERVVAKNGRITPRAAHLLAANIGNDLQVLDSEIEKLVLYKLDEPEETAVIRPEDVDLLCPYIAEANIFDLVDAIGNRNAKKASLLLQQKLSEGADPFMLFAMFVRQFRLLIQVKELADDGLNAPAISKKLRMHSFVAGKIYQQARGFSMSQLEQIYAHLLEIDVDVKTGRADMLTSLNLLVAGLTVTA